MSGTAQGEDQRTGLPLARRIGLFLGPLFLVLTLLLEAPAGMADEAWAAAGLMLMMATWWATEAIAIPATALLPIVLIPALGLGSIKDLPFFSIIPGP